MAPDPHTGSRAAYKEEHMRGRSSRRWLAVAILPPILALVACSGSGNSAGSGNTTSSGGGGSGGNSGGTTTLTEAAADSSAFSIFVSGSTVYAAGFSQNSQGIDIPGYWVDGTWTGLSITNDPNLPGSAFGGAEVDSIVVAAGNVYAGGYGYDSASSDNVPGFWLNGTWTSFDTTSGVPSGYLGSGVVNSIVVDSSGVVYAGGYQENSSTSNVPGYWTYDGGKVTWTALANPAGSGGNGYVASISVVSGSPDAVFAGGYVYDPSDTYEYGAIWYNSTSGIEIDPTSVGSSFGESVAISSIAASGSTMYAGGFYVGSGGAYEPAYWSYSGSGSPVVTTLPEAPPPSYDSYSIGSAITAIADASGAIDCGGTTIDDISGSALPAEPYDWVGGKVSTTLASPYVGGATLGGVNAIVASGSNVYAAGYVIDDWDHDQPGYWMNGQWVALPALDSQQYTVSASAEGPRTRVAGGAGVGGADGVPLAIRQALKNAR